MGTPLARNLAPAFSIAGKANFAYAANLAVICEFPTMRAAVEAYESEEYRELSKLRQKATENSTFTIMEGLDEAAKLRKAMGM